MTRHGFGLWVLAASAVLAGTATGPAVGESASPSGTEVRREASPAQRAPDDGKSRESRTGSGVRQVASGPCPEEMVLAFGACVDRYEAHLVTRGPDGSLATHPPYERPKGDHLVAMSRAGVRPQGYISRVEAARACTNAGKRLCTASEWYAACRGPEDTQYPYGERFERSLCNVGKPHLLSLLYGKNPRAWSYENFNNPELNRREGFLARTGEYAGCAGSLGVHDLVGNLHEWVADDVARALAQKLPLTDGIRARLGRNTGNGVFLGGFYSTTHEHGHGCAFTTIAHEPSYHDYSTGFRCCRDRSN